MYFVLYSENYTKIARVNTVNADVEKQQETTILS